MGLLILEIIYEEEEPVFFDTDGNPIYEGDRYWFFWKGKVTAKGQNPFEIYTSKCRSLGFGEEMSEHAIFFSTKEAAEETLDELTYTTHDGYRITEEQYKDIWGVALQATNNDIIRKGYNKGIGEYARPYKNRVWFFKKENAENYVKQNKVQYSLKDIGEALKEYGMEHHYLGIKQYLEDGKS